jgi:hypothetical protein
VVYRFALSDPVRPVRIRFDLQPAEPGVVRSRLGVVDGPEIAFDQFIYP